MKRLFLTALLIVASFSAWTQSVVVLDYSTLKPLPDVFVYNIKKTKTAVTGKDGKLNISVFSLNDTLVFRHSSYKPKKISLKEIENSGFKVFLQEDSHNLNEIVVSANKWEENSREIPNQIESIGKETVEFNNPATTADMLMQSGDVFVQKSQLGGGSPMIRGFAANRILFVLDGVRMNNAIYRSGNLQNILQADVNSVESAEIIFGPGTNVYGSDALGGVMDIHILSPVLNNKKEWRTSGAALLRYASAAKEKTAHIKINVANNKWGFLTLITFTGFDDLRMGSRGNDFYLRKEYVKTILGVDTIVKNENPLIQKFTGYSQLNMTQKLRYNIDNKSEISLNFYLSGTSKVPRYDRLIQYKKGKLKYAEWYYKPQQWLMTTLAYQNHNRTLISDDVKIILAYQNVKEGRNDRKFRNAWLRKRAETVNILSLNVDVDKNLKKGRSIFYGAELVYNYVSSQGKKINILSGEEKSAASRYPDGGTDVFNGGTYFTYKNTIDNMPLTFQTGARLSFAYLDAAFVDTSWYHLPFTEITLNNMALTGSLGMTYHPENWKLGVNLSSGFRAPNLDDVAKVFDSEPGNVVVPNNNLKPEYLYNIDFSAEKYFGNIFVVSATAFYSYLKNAMVRGDFTLNGNDSIWYDGEMSKVQAVINAGYANIYGVSGKLFINIFPSLGFKVKANYIKGYDDNGNPLRHVSPLFGKMSVEYEYKRLKMELYTFYNGKISYKNLPPSERKKTHLYVKDENGNPYSPAWFTLNFKGSYKFNKQVLLTAGIENILDKRYRPYSCGITAPGFNAMAALKISF